MLWEKRPRVKWERPALGKRGNPVVVLA